MRILLGTLLGYSLRQRERLLITILTFVLITIYIVLPTLSLAIQAIALTHLGLSVHRERLARPKQTRVPAIKGLDYQSAVTILRGSHLNIRVMATRYDLPQHRAQFQVPLSQRGQRVIRWASLRWFRGLGFDATKSRRRKRQALWSFRKMAP